MAGGMNDAPLAMADVIASAQVLMQPAERLLLFSLVRALRPSRALEIGTHKGGSAMIIVAALDEIGAGTLVCIDPAPVVSEADWGRVAHRATLLEGKSPDVLDEARAVVGGPIEFAFIDGDHGYGGVLRDIEGVLPLLADGAYVLFHDAHFREVRQAIDHCLMRYALRLMDCGMLSVEENRDPTQHDVVWGGLRLLRYLQSPRVGEHAATNGAERTEEELARILTETTGLPGAEAARAARGLVDARAFPIDYLAECRALWKEGPPEFVNGMYRLLLSREPDPMGVQYYCGRLRLGDSRLDIVRMFAFSEEARDRGLRTDWMQQLAALSPSFPMGYQWTGGTWNRRLRSWIRRRPALARAARYAMVASRAPWTVERLHALVAEQQQALEQQRRQIGDLERQVGGEAGPDGVPVLNDRIAAIAGQVKIQTQTLARLATTVERIARDLASR
jgi:predicted O-methyltransferase YrrM